MTFTVVRSIFRTYRYNYNRNIRLISTRSQGPRLSKRTDLVQEKQSYYKEDDSKKITFYFLRRYLQYIKNANKIIERRFPTAVRTYRVFMDGLKDFYVDLKDFVRIVKILYTPGKSFDSLTRKELELYHQMPKDMVKVAPVLIFSTLPFAYYIVFPLIYMFPRQLLTSHFWNLQQKSEFSVLMLKDRLLHNRPVFRHIQAELDRLKEHELYCSWRNILGMLGSGVQPSVKEILMCRQLFMDKPYELHNLKRNHVKELLRMHGLRVGFFRRRTRLQKYGEILLAMDKAILKEGGVHNLPTDALRKACLIRGLNPSNMSSDDLILWLTKWITISKEVDDDRSLSLLLHSPVLLAYNEQTNWSLIYLKK